MTHDLALALLIAGLTGAACWNLGWSQCHKRYYGDHDERALAFFAVLWFAIVFFTFTLILIHGVG